jgi:hypothetical protein
MYVCSWTEGVHPLWTEGVHTHCCSIDRWSAARCDRLIGFSGYRRRVPMRQDGLAGFGIMAASARPLHSAHTLFLLQCVSGAHAHRARTCRL